MCTSLLAECLLSHARSTAAVVDTSGNFDVMRLYSFLLARLQDDAGLLQRYLRDAGAEGSSIEDVAAKMLDRVKIMRAFDLVGVMEAVGEVRDELEGRTQPPAETTVEEPKSREQQEETEQKATMRKSPVEPPKETMGLEKPREAPKRTFVADSDEEDALLFEEESIAPTSATLVPEHAPPAVEEDEMLFVDGADERILVSSPPWASSSPSQPPTPTTVAPDTDLPSNSTRPAFLLVDNLAHVVTPLLKKNYVQGKTLHLSALLIDIR